MPHKIQDHFLVFTQFLGIALCLYPVTPMGEGNPVYLVISAFGMFGGIATLFHNRIGNFNVYPQIKSKAKLVTSGPYAFVRHPMYLFLAVIMFGVTLFNFHFQSLIGFTLLVLAISIKALKEEKLLTEHFPEYREYMSRTKRMIPWIW